MNILTKEELKSIKGGADNCCARLEIEGEFISQTCGLSYEEAYGLATQYGMMRSIEPTAHGYYNCRLLLA